MKEKTRKLLIKDAKVLENANQLVGGTKASISQTSCLTCGLNGTHDSTDLLGD